MKPRVSSGSAWVQHWVTVTVTGFGVKIDLKVTKTIKIDTCLPEVVVFAGKKPPEAPRSGAPHLLAEPPGRPQADFWAG